MVNHQTCFIYSAETKELLYITDIPVEARQVGTVLALGNPARWRRDELCTVMAVSEDGDGLFVKFGKQ